MYGVSQVEISDEPGAAPIYWRSVGDLGGSARAWLGKGVDEKGIGRSIKGALRR